MSDIYNHNSDNVKEDRGAQEFNKLVSTIMSTTAVKTVPEVKGNYFLFDANDAQPTYIGINESADALTSATTWVIYKILYSGSNITSIRRKLGAWDSRASLF